MSAFGVPRLHDDLPGIGGALKEIPADFEVDEIPAYEPAGEGEHLFLRVQKRDVGAEDLLRHVRQTLELSDRDIGCAGLKDRRAVTRQWLSVPAAAADRIERLDTERIAVLETARHPHKLRTGHLQGNRFRIVVAGASPEALMQAEELCARVAARGVPNAYGDQRFGADDANVAAGLAMVRGEPPARVPGKRRRRPDARRQRFVLSALQSALFNRYLAARMRDGLLEDVIEGDVVQVVGSHTCRRTEDLASDSRRFAERDVVPTGPIFGSRMVAPAGEAAARERALLEDAGLTAAMFAGNRKHLSGTRRALLVWPADLTVAPDPRGLVFSFALPAGSYATVAMREIMGEG